ncbi:hypothetical protein VPHF86_0134 [Vibrio phage F86]
MAELFQALAITLIIFVNVVGFILMLLRLIDDEWTILRAIVMVLGFVGSAAAAIFFWACWLWEGVIIPSKLWEALTEKRGKKHE